MLAQCVWGSGYIPNTTENNNLINTHRCPCMCVHIHVSWDNNLEFSDIIICTCGYMFLHVYMCRCTCEWGYQNPFLRCHLSLFSKQNISLAWSSLFRVDWLASKPQGSSRLYLPSTGITSAYHHAWLFFAWDIELEPRSSCLQDKDLTH